jgi:release factor glutamine methyltransferase
VNSGPEIVPAAVSQAASRLAAAGLDEARSEAERLLAAVLDLPRHAVWTHPERSLSAQEQARFSELVSRRERREPLAYILGEAEFFSLPLRVTPAVLVPRPETERLVEVALELAAGAKRAAEVGVGSGAIAIALARVWPEVRIWATDTSAAALEVAAENGRRHGVSGRVTLLAGELLDPLPPDLHAMLDAVVSNPPYIRTDEFPGLEPEVRDYEPREALDGGPDGLAVIRPLIAAAPAYLRRGGLLALEVGAGQGAVVVELMQAAGLIEVRTFRDYAGHERVVAGRVG